MCECVVCGVCMNVYLVQKRPNVKHMGGVCKQKSESKRESVNQSLM